MVGGQEYEQASVEIAPDRWRRERRHEVGAGADVLPRYRRSGTRSDVNETLAVCGSHYSPLVVAARLAEHESRRSRWNAQAYDRVREGMHHYNLQISEWVFKHMFDMLGCPTRRAMRFEAVAGADYDDRLMSRAVMAYLWLALGRVPHSTAYKQVAASGHEPSEIPQVCHHQAD